MKVKQPDLLLKTVLVCNIYVDSVFSLVLSLGCKGETHQKPGESPTSSIRKPHPSETRPGLIP